MGRPMGPPVNQAPTRHVGVAGLSVAGVRLEYGRTVALAGVDLSVPQGVMAAIVGPNGAGKSSLLKAVLGLEPATGEVSVLGLTGQAAREQIAYVPQRTTVDWDFPASVLDVVLMGLYRELRWWRRIGRPERDRAMRALEEVGMDGLARAAVTRLSGGQQQRVFLARALVQDAAVYLLDEPLTGVDAPSEAALMATLQRLAASGRTVIAVHHDLGTLAAYFGWLALLDRRIVAAGPLEATLTQENLSLTYGRPLAPVAYAGAPAHA